MGKEISTFSSCDMHENRMVNYCSLILQSVYQRSPEAFQFLISSLLCSPYCFDILPSFQQQLKQKDIPALMLSQKSFYIVFETKNDDWPYLIRLNERIEENIKADIKILFLLSNKPHNDVIEQIWKAKECSLGRFITIQDITYDELLGALSGTIRSISSNRNDYLYSLLEEFENYLSETGILPRWDRRILIAPCGKKIDEIEKGFYTSVICDNDYNRARFFGAYWSKKINYLAEIKAAVKIDRHSSGARFSVIWNNCQEDESELIKHAKECLNIMTPERKAWVCEFERQIILLDEKQKVDIRKETDGGLRGKTYLEVDADTLSEAVTQLEEMSSITHESVDKTG